MAKSGGGPLNNLQQQLAEVQRLLDSDRTEALARAAALAAAHPEVPQTALLHAAALSLLQDDPAAVAVLRGLWQRTPSPLVAFNLGYCRRQSGDYEGALRAFLAALTLDEQGEVRALAADTAAVLGEHAFARRLLAGRPEPLLAFRDWGLGGPWPASLRSTEVGDRVVLFWMKYDCHLYRRLDDKAQLAGLLPAAASYWPASFALPEQTRALRTAMAQAGEASWVFKPAHESGGRGMQLLAGPRAALPDRAGVVQRFIDPPFLYRGRKPNLRLLLALPEPRPEQARLWAGGLCYFATEPYTSGPGPARAGAIANLLRGERGDFDRPLGALPAHVLDLENFLATVPGLGDLRGRLIALAGALVRDIDRGGFFADVRGVGDAFLPRFVGLDVGLDAAGRPWLFEIERYPGLGGVSPLTAAINARFRRDWMDWLRNGRRGERFLPLG